MQLPPIVKDINDWLEGQPDSVLTLLLLVIAAIVVIVALTGKPVSKAVLALWLILP